MAASCAAILTVYTAGSWRTRDEARRFAIEGQVRRPARPAPVPAVSLPAAVASAVPDAMPPALPAASEPRSVTTKSLKVDAASLPPPVASPQPSGAATPAVAAVAVQEKPEPASEAQPAAVVAVDEAEAAPLSHKPWLDGYYTGWGTSPHGDIQAFVTIKDGRIINSGVATCDTRYPCSVINHILLQPIELQGADVDRVSRATESGDAYYYGLMRALENAETGTFRSARP